MWKVDNKPLLVLTATGSYVVKLCDNFETCENYIVSMTNRKHLCDKCVQERKRKRSRVFFQQMKEERDKNKQKRLSKKQQEQVNRMLYNKLKIKYGFGDYTPQMIAGLKRTVSNDRKRLFMGKIARVTFDEMHSNTIKFFREAKKLGY